MRFIIRIDKYRKGAALTGAVLFYVDGNSQR